MDYSKIIVGMKVRITKIDTTHQLHNSNMEMNAMVGGKFKVRKISDSAKGVSHPYMITLTPDPNQYNWDPEDLERIGAPSKIPMAEKFDPKNLII